MIHLDDATITDLLDLPAVEHAIWGAFTAWGRGRAATSQRVRSVAGGGMASAMAAVVPPFSGGKVYATHDGRFTFVNVLFDLEGRLLCTLDGDALTRLRTPATCAAAIRRLAVARPEVAAVIGAGRQGWHHLTMLGRSFPSITEIRVHDARADVVERVVARAREAGIPAGAARSARGAVDGAEVIVTATQATEPLFEAAAVSSRALLCAVGATKHDRCEIAPELVARCATVVCDDVVGSRVECGDLIRAAAQGRFDWDRAVELHAVAAGTAVVERAGGAPVLFETQGVALQDVAAAGLAWERWLVAQCATREEALATLSSPRGHRPDKETGS